jgi:hypothetical protein
MEIQVLHQTCDIWGFVTGLMALLRDRAFAYQAALKVNVIYPENAETCVSM